MGKKFGLDKQYANIGKGYLQHPVINSVKPKPKPSKLSAGGEMNQMNIKGYMGGGASRGYGAARTSGMGLQDESLMPGKMVRAKNGKMLNFKSDKERKDYTKQAIASLEGITESFKDKLNPMKAQRLLDRLPKKKIKKARFGDFMNTFIADDTRSVAGKSGGADSGTAGEMRSKLGKSDVVEKKKIKNYIKKKVEQTKTVIKKTKEAAKKTGTILATPIKKFHELAEENVRKNGPVRIFKRSYSKGGGMDMGKKEEPTQWITKKEKPTQWITKKEKKQNWITKKEK